METSKRRLLAIIGPGILVAATGVGAGDLAMAALTGTRLGVAVLWAVVLGAAIKFCLNEGLARWQLATGDTLLEGFFKHFGLPAKILFLTYFLFWSFFVGSALMSACGVAAHALLPVFDNANVAKIVFGILHSILGVVLVRVGGFRLFEKVMAVCIALMFVTVVVTAILVTPDWPAVASGLFRFSIPDADGQGRSLTIALMGGVGGTLTVLCYGYWIREVGRTRTEEVTVCRIDLAIGYFMTALFGLGMVVIGSTIQVEGTGATLVVKLGERLGATLGPGPQWLFLIGAWGAVFSSLLGVWQSVPYLFADFWRMTFSDRTNAGIEPAPIDTNSGPYRVYLYLLAIIPAVGLFRSFAQMQTINAIVGASFMPMLAFALLLLNGHSRWVGRLRNHWVTNVVLVLIIGFFLYAGWLEVRATF